jgi:transcriptional regulator with XRE-family HTH domain
MTVKFAPHRLPCVSEAQKIIGACIRAIREQRGLSQEALAGKASISYQYLSGVETGKENFSISVLENIATALEIPLHRLVALAFTDRSNAPRLEPRYLRRNVPLPTNLTFVALEAAINRTQDIVHRINAQMRLEVGQPLQNLVQGNNFSGLVSNILTNAMDQCTTFKHNHHQRYPDLKNAEGVGLEIKTTINVGKGGESHNGHSGWHLIGCFQFLPSGDIEFVHIMVAEINSHQHEEPDWSYVSSKLNTETGSRRTETYTTNGFGTTKLRDGSVYLNPNVVGVRRWKQSRRAPMPTWSIFSDHSERLL